MATRAVASEDKQIRRNAILEAARNLFTSGDGTLPTASEIASVTGLAKGTVYLYFETKEEIFATLLVEGWRPFMQTIPTIFTGSKVRRAHKIKLFISSLVKHLDSHPELLRLDALGSGVLEKKMTADALRKFKDDFTSPLLEAGESIDDFFKVPKGRGLQLIMRSYALTRGLWQSAQHDEQAHSVGVVPALMLTPDLYLQELSEALTEYWRGALA